MNKAVFIDRDGTLIRDIPYNVNPELITPEYYAAEMLQLLKSKHYLLILISNQPGIAKGFFSQEDLYKMHAGLRRKLNIHFDGIYYCPHLLNGVMEDYAIDCDCHKPRPGLLLKAAKEFNIDTHRSWMIGDILNDVEAGNRAGCKTILIDNGNETEWMVNAERIPHHMVMNLKEATETILQDELEAV